MPLLGSKVLRVAAEEVRGWLADELYPQLTTQGPLVVLHLGVDVKASCIKLEVSRPAHCFLGAQARTCGSVCCRHLTPARPPAAAQRTARNVATFRVPDEDGYQPRQAHIGSSEPLGCTRKTELPLERVLRRLPAANFELSDDAGTFVCNFTFFISLALASKLQQETGRAVHVLFVHVPPVERMGEAEQLLSLQALLRELAASVAGGGEDAAERQPGVAGTGEAGAGASRRAAPRPWRWCTVQ